eukprot:180467-Chlamydomonas_euryale.AAC.1
MQAENEAHCLQTHALRERPANICAESSRQTHALREQPADIRTERAACLVHGPPRLGFTSGLTLGTPHAYVSCMRAPLQAHLYACALVGCFMRAPL